MSSSIAFLAYKLRRPEVPEATRLRVKHSQDYLRPLYSSELRRTQMGNHISGLIGWSPTDREIDWEFYSVQNGSATAWLHVPGIAGRPDSGADPWELATEVVEGRVHPSDVGSPFALARWSNQELVIINDMLGLVRLFHYRFEGGEVWSSRQGLAHVFMGATPVRNELAWSGIATLGWSPGGETHIGYGKQLPGGSRVVVDVTKESASSLASNSFGSWLDHTRTKPEPTVSRNLSDMKSLVSTSQRWPETAIADLSGGKDSRVSAAIGITSGSISSVKTINTDPGEVDTATQLLQLAHNPVEHIIQDRAKRSNNQRVPFLDRLSSNQLAFEGRYRPETAFYSPFHAFKTPARAKFNGLGGEVLAGGNFYEGIWHERMIGAPVDASIDRLARKARVGVGASPNAKEIVAESTRTFAEWARNVGASTAGEVLDLFYCKDRMPNWSVTYATPNSLSPLFAPSVLAVAMHSLGAPKEPGFLHERLISACIPAWSGVPFYTPKFATRSYRPLWANEEWTEIRQFIHERHENSPSYDPKILKELLSIDTDPEAGKRHEVAIMRFLWDQSFDQYLEHLTEQTNRVSAELAEIEHHGGRNFDFE